MLILLWNCVVCDSSGQVSYTPSTTMAEVLSAIVLQHENEKGDCPIILTGRPQLSIWEPEE